MTDHKAPASTSKTTRAVPLAIIGIGCLFPKSKNLREYWATVKNGVDTITEIPPTHWATEDYFDSDPKKPDFAYAKRGGFIDAIDFDPLSYGIPPNVIEATDTSQLLGMVAAAEALKDAGYGKSRQFDRDRVSVVLGVTGTLELVIPLGARLGHPIWRRSLREAGVDDAVAEDVVQRIADSYVPWQENSFPGLLGNVVAGRISKFLDLGGTNCVVDAACASSLSAIHLAAMELESGRSDMVVTGGIDTFNDIFMYMCFSKTPALSPTGNAKPFDENGDGTILGEGLGVVVLKRLDDAQRDGDRVYAVLRAIGSSSDGKGEAIYAPSSEGQKKAIRRAYESAGVTPDTIELLEAHGTGTSKGDAVEARALNDIYRDAEREGRWCAIGSVKSQIGHTKAAAGIAGLIKAALALHHKVQPPTIKVSRPVEELRDAPLFVNTTSRPWVASSHHPRRAALSAFGFGGSNFHCVLEEADPVKREADWDGEVQLFTYSATDAAGLRPALSGLTGLTSWDSVRAAAGASRKSFDHRAPRRLAFVVERERTDLPKLVATVAKMLDRNSDEPWSTPDGIFYGVGEASGKLAMIFPGQGSQYVGMLRDLSCLFPQMLDALSDANEAFAEGDSRPLTDLIYPPPAFDDESKQTQEADLRAIEVAQPAIGAVSVGAFSVLRDFGVMPEAVAGHSYGELMALCAAGSYDADALYSLSRLRAQLMASGGGDKGAMLAVRAPLQTVEQLVAEEQLDVVVANRNAPTQAVLSGAAVEIERALEACARRKIQSKKIPVAAAFHSPLVAHAKEPFLAALREIDFSAAAIPVFANTSAREYPASIDEARELLAAQLASPVDFVSEILAMHDNGVRTFIEVGPGSRLTALVNSILEERDHHAVALDASSGQRSGVTDFARLLAHLSAEGREMELSKWDDNWVAPEEPAKKPKLTVSLSGANHFIKKPTRPAVEKKSLPPVAAATPRPVNLPPLSAAAPTATPVQLATPPAPPAQLDEILRITQESMLALQRMQEQTANLHAQFLAGQETAARTFQTLLDQQSRLLGIGGSAIPSTTSEVPASQQVVRQPQSVAQASPAITAAPMPMTRPAEPPQPVAPAGPDLRVEHTLLDVVSAKTGYPTEMLELDMTLDADLGIDSIKRVEILSALEELLPDAPRIEAEHLGRLQTLRAIAEHLSTGATAAGGHKPAPAPAAASRGSDTSLIESVLLDVVSAKTGYPTEMLELDMTLDADLGIDSIKRVEILSALEEQLPDAPRIEAEHLGRLQTLRAIVEHLSATTRSIAQTPAPGPASSSQKVESVLLAVVAEKTGYPSEMLELGMALDADLGIDSIKRVEILSALEEQLPDAPRIEAEHLGRLQTLRSIVEHLAAGISSTHTAPEASPSADATTVESVLLAVVAEKTGYPSDMLELEMALDADLGIDSIKRVEILSALEEQLPDSPRIEAEHLGRLQTLRSIVDYLSAPPSPKAAPIPARAAEPAPAHSAARLRRSVVKPMPVADLADESDTRASMRRSLTPSRDLEVLVTDDGGALAHSIVAVLAARGHKARVIAVDAIPDSAITGLVIVSPEKGADDDFVARSLFAAKTASHQLRDNSADSLFATVSRQDGVFGFDRSSTAGDSLSGSLAGLAKTAAREWPSVHCKAIDAGRDVDNRELAEMIVDEILLAGPVEVGLSLRGRITLELDDLEPSAMNELGVGQGDVVVVSGGARGVTAAAAIAIAGTAKPTLLLLGRSALPEAEPSWLSGLTGEAEIKKSIAANSGEALSPRELQSRFESILANREVGQTLRRIEATGAKVAYRSVDIRDRDAVASVLGEARNALGPIRGLVHGAGVLADRLIEEKTPEQFDRVFGTKVIGARNLLEATATDELRFIAFFSSSTARFGRVGQVDYAMANETLNKIAQTEARRRSACRVVSFNFGPWNGGMVTPGHASLFAREGVGLIDLEPGAALIIDELCRTPDAPVEVVVLAETGTKADSERPARHAAATISPAFSLQLRVEDFPFLGAHVMNGRAVLPMAMMLEWAAQGAIARNPGMRIHGLDDARLFKGLTIGAGETHELRVAASKATKAGAHYESVVELSGTDPYGREHLHARARVRLGDVAPARETSSPLPVVSPFPLEIGRIYTDVLFHGPELQSIVSVDGSSAEGILAFARTAPPPSAWMTQPMRNSWLTDPLAIDSAFQLLILWSAAHRGARSLPVSLEAFRQFRPWPGEGVRVAARVRRATDKSAISDIEFLDRESGELVARIEGYECVLDPSLESAFRLNRLSDGSIA